MKRAKSVLESLCFFLYITIHAAKTRNIQSYGAAIETPKPHPTRRTRHPSHAFITRASSASVNPPPATDHSTTLPLPPKRYGAMSFFSPFPPFKTRSTASTVPRAASSAVPPAPTTRSTTPHQPPPAPPPLLVQIRQYGPRVHHADRACGAHSHGHRVQHVLGYGIHLRSTWCLNRRGRRRRRTETTGPPRGRRSRPRCVSGRTTSTRVEEAETRLHVPSSYYSVRKRGSEDHGACTG